MDTPVVKQLAEALCCAHGPSVDLKATFAIPLADVDFAPPPLPQGSRRARLWELPADLHCAVIGVCLPMDALRHLVAKHYEGPCIVGDYEVHSVVVHACKSRTPLIERLQKELDRRYAGEIKQFQSAKTDASVKAIWLDATADGPAAGGLAGALWASLTHPCTNDALRTRIGHDIHMIQHQVGDEARRNASDLASARQQSAQHQQAYSVAHAKLLQLQAQHAQEARVKQQQLADAQAALLGLKAQNEALTAQLASLQQSALALDAREKLSLRVDGLTAQNVRLKEQLAELGSRKPGQAEITAAPPGPAPLDAVRPAAIKALRQEFNLNQKSVLCVGGRSGAVASYRDAVERAGGQFMHHDGGIEHNHHRLDANLAAADCVVCQTGYISHTAYWLVKNYCKKSGKSCVYLDRPSVSTFVEGLSTLPMATQV
jgi:hypothetical protein